MESKTKSSIYPLAMTAVMAAVIAVAAPFSIPAWGEVSFTLCTFVLYLAPCSGPVRPGLEAGGGGYAGLYSSGHGGHACVQ